MCGMVADYRVRGELYCHECLTRGHMVRLEYIADNGYTPSGSQPTDAFEAEIAISGIVPDIDVYDLRSSRYRRFPGYNARTSPSINRYSSRAQLRWAETQLRNIPQFEMMPSLQRQADHYRRLAARLDARTLDALHLEPLPPGRVYDASLVADAINHCEREFERMRQRNWANVTADGFAVRYHQDFTGMHRLVKDIFDFCEKKDNKFDFPIAQFSQEMQLPRECLMLMKRQRKYFANSSCFGGGLKDFDALVRHFAQRDPGQNSNRDWHDEI